jgi:hypothetical protein
MLGQNIITLLAALIGGLLSTLGGFLANTYIQSSTNKIQKRKEIRDILENIFKYALLTNSILTRKRIETLNTDDKQIDTKNILEIKTNVAHMSMLVKLYIPVLEEYTDPYIDAVYKLYKVLESRDRKNLEYATYKVDTATNKLCDKILDLLKKEGYSYL